MWCLYVGLECRYEVKLVVMVGVMVNIPSLELYKQQLTWPLSIVSLLSESIQRDIDYVEEEAHP